MTDLMTQLRDYGRQIEADPVLSAEAPVVDVAPRPPQTRWGRGLAWAAAAFAVVLALGALYLAFSGDDGQVVDRTTVPTPTTTLVPEPEPPVSGSMWPQSSLEEVQEAQELADAGNPDFTWQLEPGVTMYDQPGDTEIIARFIHEELGWEEFVFNGNVGWEEVGTNLNFVRCAPGETNPLYPDDDYAGRCAPTIDELRYETVSIDVAQPVQSDPSGIWVVTDWTMGTFSQVVPPTAEAAVLVDDFLQARIEGEGAERFLTDGEVPLLYTTTAGAPYERFEFEQVGGPRWPFGSMDFGVRLFAGDTVVEQRFSTPHEGELGLEYGAIGGVAPTIENGQPVPVPYDIFDDGQVTLHAPYPWRIPWMNYWGLMADQGTTHDRIHMLRDPVPVGPSCEAEGAASTDAESLAMSIRSDPDLETTEPVAVSLGGAEAFWMDVEAAAGASVCDYELLGNRADQDSAWIRFEPGNRLRLYLLDLPDGLSTRILAIAVIAPESRFEAVMEAAEPILDSIEFNGG